MSKSADSSGMMEALTQQFKNRIEQVDSELISVKKQRDEMDA